MTIQLRTKPTDRLIELGGGARPQVRPNLDVRQCYDNQGRPTVDVVANFEEKLPLENQSFDGVFCQYALEHITWRKVPQFIAEIYRILRPSGKAVLVTSNTEAQIQWIKDHPEGWDDHNAFESFSGVLFGDCDYPENSHKCYFNPTLLAHLFEQAGFTQVEIMPYGARNTDLVVQAIRPAEEETHSSGCVMDSVTEKSGPNVLGSHVEQETKPEPAHTLPAAFPARADLFDKYYFHGGAKVGGYAREGYRDFPVHEITFQHILIRRPESVLEIGCARGFVLKRLQDAGIRVAGLEISKHCQLTKVINDIFQHDLCTFPWPIPDQSFDLCFSMATLEHIPEEFIPGLLAEIKRTCKRSLHGVDFGEKDDGFDKTHCSLYPYTWWRQKFAESGLSSHAHEILNKEDLEQGRFPEEVLRGDGKVKLNIGCAITMFHHGWVNIDVNDLSQYAQSQGYQFQRLDVRQGLPYPTGGVDLLFLCHFLEHFSYQEAKSFLKECRRVIKPTGAVRILVPDAAYLTALYTKPEVFLPRELADFDEISDGAAACPTRAGKLWELLFSGHQAAYDEQTLALALKEAGFIAHRAYFRKTEVKTVEQILQETLDMHQCLSLIMDATPLLG